MDNSDSSDKKELKIKPDEQVIPVNKGYLIIRKQWCKGCKLCVYACKRGVIKVVGERGKIQVVNPGNCNLCRLCESICPDFVIKVKKRYA